MSAAVRALMAASAIGFAGAAWAQSGAEAENGVHAVPVSPVGQSALPSAARQGARLTLQAVSTAPSPPAPDEVAPLDSEPVPPPAAAVPGQEETASEEAAVMGTQARPQPAAVAEAPPEEAHAEVVQAAAEPAPAPPPPVNAPVNAPAVIQAAAEAAPAVVAPPVNAPALAAQEAAPSQAEPVDAPAPAQLAEAPPVQEPPAADPQPQPRMQLARAEAAPPPADDGIRQHVGFPRRSADAASAFVRYMDRASRIDAALKSGQAVQTALDTGSAYDARQLEEGMIAYGAIAALQSQTFVYGVMDVAAREGSRRELIETLLADPAAAARLPGAQEAAGLAAEAIGREGRRVVITGKALKQAAYDVQLQPWSKARPGDQPGRLANAKALSAQRTAARDGDVAKLLARISSVQPAADGSTLTPVAARSIALAALSVLDGAGDGSADRLAAVTSEPESAQCLKLAKLNLFQCLSVAGPEYEDVYCLGQHAVLDTGQCVSAAAKPLNPVLQAALPRRERSQVSIPTGGMSRAPQLQ